MVDKELQTYTNGGNRATSKLGFFGVGESASCHVPSVFLISLLVDNQLEELYLRLVVRLVSVNWCASIS